MVNFFFLDSIFILLILKDVLVIKNFVLYKNVNKCLILSLFNLYLKYFICFVNFLEWN